MKLGNSIFYENFHFFKPYVRPSFFKTHISIHKLMNLRLQAYNMIKYLPTSRKSPRSIGYISRCSTNKNHDVFQTIITMFSKQNSRCVPNKNYDVFLIDLWGVMHNGIHLYPGAIEVVENLNNQVQLIII